MIWVDYCILAVTLLSVVIGVLRGFTRELFSLLTWGLALALTLLFGEQAAEGLKFIISIPALRVVAGYAACFFGGLLLGAIISMLFVEMVRNSRLAAADRTLGAGFGILRALLVTAVFVMLADNMGARGESWWQRSKIIDKTEWLARGVEALMPERWLASLRPDNTETSAQPADQPQEES